RVAPGLGVLGARPDTARLIRHVPGSVLVRVADAGAARRLLVTPGRRAARFEDAACTIDCSLSDLEDARAAGLSPMQLFAQGKLRISGNVQIALALSAVLA
ncbi:MAG: SCP2 sterol-binding domain-containing protein, partial [Deltaproteobacteria bacterium]|nr:SCP2 sterol-binding domain-containing protein [Deltaproteobacteria bacterium]